MPLNSNKEQHGPHTSHRRGQTLAIITWAQPQCFFLVQLFSFMSELYFSCFLLYVKIGLCLVLFPSRRFSCPEENYSAFVASKWYLVEFTKFRDLSVKSSLLLIVWAESANFFFYLKYCLIFRTIVGTKDNYGINFIYCFVFVCEIVFILFFLIYELLRSRTTELRMLRWNIPLRGQSCGQCKAYLHATPTSSLTWIKKNNSLDAATLGCLFAEIGCVFRLDFGIFYFYRVK